ncbi:MAG: DUF3772 domain-containing protein [Pseudomonadota bacterium]
MAGWRATLFAGLLAGLALAPMLAPAAFAQTTGNTAPSPAAADEKPAAEMDYSAWEAMATRAEADLADTDLAQTRLDTLRGQLADWRAALLNAQSANASRIATLRTQIDALGPAPKDGETEADEIGARRQTLAEQLVRVQAPGIAAEEAYRRADGLIREIDRILRERQADELLQLWPSPVNPANWPEAVIALTDTLFRLWDETQSGWSDPDARETLNNNLPLILVLLVVAAGLLTRGRQGIEKLALRVQVRSSARGRQVWGLIASLGQILVPTLGVLALSTAALRSGMLGEIGTSVNAMLTTAGFALFVAIWLGSRAFPKAELQQDFLNLSPERRAEGRFLSVLLGLMIAVEALRYAAMNAQAYSDATTSVLSFPILLSAGLVLWRMGALLRLPAREQAAAPPQTPASAAGGQSYSLRLLAFVGQGVGVVGLLAPVLAGFGYVQAASALIYPAIMSLGVLTLLFVLQRLIGDLWALVTRNEATGREALVPVLAGFVLTLVSLPVFALIWGARLADITEIWTRFGEGFQLGATRISPTNFMVFAVVFVIGYMITRLFQGALRTTILPKTTMDSGGQTALVAGVGYVGIFLAALVAINAAGIDLSGLAIVAGALSVGIGFGLQNIVSNFISGIILLIERPVSEGDWIEVGGVQGRVRSISVRSTRIETFDRNDVIVPNADLITGQVTNWTRFNLSGRLIVPVMVALASDSRKVEAVLREIAEAQPLAVLNPPPLVVFVGYTALLMNFEIRLILRDVNFSVQVRSDINHQIMQKFAEAGIHVVMPPIDPDAKRTADAVLVLAGLADRIAPSVLPDAVADPAARSGRDNDGATKKTDEGSGP